jgi:signal transduction histidine kinase
MNFKPLQHKQNNLSISRAYFLLFLILTVTFLVGIGSIWIYKEVSNFTSESEAIRIKSIAQQKKLLISKTDECINFINYQNTQAESRTKKRLKNFVDQAHAIASNIYLQNKGKISDKEIKLRIKQAISPLRFSNNRGYIFINTLAGVGVLYPFSKENEGQDLINLQDLNKNYLIKNEINLMIYQDDAYTKYENTNKVKNKFNAYTKVSFIKKFAPYSWYFGSYSFLDDLQDENQKEALNRISQISVSGDNYFFVYKKDGTCLYHGDDSLSIGENYRDYKNVHRRKNVESLLSHAEIKKEGFVEYEDPSSNKGTKVSYIATIDEWDWVIGAGVYTKDIDESIAIASTELRETVLNYIYQIVVLIGIAILIFYFTSKFISKKMNRNFVSFNNFFRKASTQSFKINPDELYFPEFREMSKTINKMIDVRSQKENELQIAKEHAEESDRLKSSFLANMSHEIRTPMNAIIGFSELLQQDDLPIDTRRQFFSHIRNSGNSLLNLINDIIDFSKIESGELKISKTIFNLNQLFEELHQTFKKIKTGKGKDHINLQFSKGLNDEQSSIYTDPYRLKQIITNLIENALKFTEKGSVIVSYQLNEDELIFSVKDTGIGISKDKQDVIFNQFRQADDSHARKYGGTGLGLSISKKLTKLLNGKLWLESTVNVGSSFFISIPHQKDKTPRSDYTSTSDYSSSRKKLAGEKILITDDY